MFLPLYCLVMDWFFPLKLSYRIESLRIWDHLMYVLHVLICGDNGIFTWSTWCINFRVQWPCELMHKGWHTFSSWLSGRIFGALFVVLCVGWIDESEIVWCISYNHTHGYLRWHWSCWGSLQKLKKFYASPRSIYGVTSNEREESASSYPWRSRDGSVARTRLEESYT